MSKHSLFAKKKIDASQFKNGLLERNLTAVGLTAMGVGAVVGAAFSSHPELLRLNMPVQGQCYLTY